MTKIAELAADMNVSENDMASFVNCLKVWTDKGMTLEQAIERNMQQMQRLVMASYERHPAMRAIVVDLYDDLRAAA
jgi:hypothetical protein